MLSLYESRMIDRARHNRPLPRLAMTLALLGLGLALSGCADMSDSMTSAFADPAKYDLYNCKQLETERKSLAKRAAELQGLMAKAETGAAGAVVSELAYRNDYIAVRGQSRNADEAWRRNKCRESPQANTDTPDTPPARDTPSARAKPVPPSRSGGAVY
jgi:hypothetical protein